MKTIQDHSTLEAFLRDRCMRARGLSCPLVRLWRGFKSAGLPAGMTRDTFCAALAARGISLIADARGQTIAQGVALIEEPAAV